MTVLVTGGAGYIGSHLVLALTDRGERPVVLDNLMAGRRELVSPKALFVEGDVADTALVRKLVADHGIDAVVHFAGSLLVDESVSQPLSYYENNTVKSRTLIETCVAAKVKHFLFSSTAAVYGAPTAMPIDEGTPLAPINPYGRSKLMTEWVLADVAHAHDLRYVALRYFNVAGADSKGRSGQVRPKATHLINVASEVAAGKRARLDIYGTDYPTPDGTCIRDYIHVSDLADVHVVALDHLRGGGTGGVFNCGYGRGYSVLEVIDTMSRELGRELPTARVGRRAGDPPALVAGVARIRDAMGWHPRHDDLGLIVRSAMEWEAKLRR